MQKLGVARPWQERYSALQNEIPIQETPQVNRDDTVFSETSQSQKGQPCGPRPRAVREEPRQRARRQTRGGEGVQRARRRFGKKREAWRWAWPWLPPARAGRAPHVEVLEPASVRRASHAFMELHGTRVQSQTSNPATV